MRSKPTLRRRMFLKACVMSACLFEAVGCPQIFGDALQSSLRSFVEVGLPAALLSGLDLEGLLGELVLGP